MRNRWARRGLRWAGSAVWLRALAAMVSCGFFLACGGEYCRGDDCGCEGKDECIVSCQRDNCDIQCSNTSSSCGAVCGDGCDFECSDTNHCSSFSGDNSIIECHNSPSCASECGANCQYSAYSVSEMRVTVGPGSTVECTSLALCDVKCLGDCEVICNSVSRCEVDCEDGDEDAGGADGRVICD